jgi:Mor family transcriptional regulator
MRPKHTTPVEITCAHCGTLRIWTPRNSSDRQPLFCGRACNAKSRAFLALIPCRSCGRDFQPTQSKQQFCSRKCRYDIPDTTDESERFWHFVQKSDECWLWQGRKNWAGYGLYLPVGCKKNQVQRAHRFIYEFLNGELPDHIAVMHRCDNPPCVRPDHLSAGTWGDNNRDRVTKGRHISEDKAPSAKLTLTQANEIRQRHSAGGISQGELSRIYGVSGTTIFRIVHGRTYHVPTALRSEGLG